MDETKDESRESREERIERWWRSKGRRRGGGKRLREQLKRPELFVPGAVALIIAYFAGNHMLNLVFSGDWYCMMEARRTGDGWSGVCDDKTKYDLDYSYDGYTFYNPVSALVAVPYTAILGSQAWLDQARSSSGHEQASARSVAERPSNAAQQRTASFAAQPAQEAQPDEKTVQDDAAAVPLPEHLQVAELAAARKVIKDAQVLLETADVKLAMNRVTAIAAQTGGYVLETRSDLSRPEGDSAFVKIAVPVDAFEPALSRVRNAGDRVLSETASGTDVSQDFVDLESQIRNLEVKEARIRAFMDDTQSIDKAMEIGERLSQIEGEIAQRRARLDLMAQRAAMSTIAVEFREPPAPEPPEIIAAPPPPPPAWSARAVAEEAFETLSVVLRHISTVAIWIGIVVLPLAIPLVAAFWAWRRWRHRLVPA